MLKLNAGFSRKVGEPNYGSRGASVNVELELESHLVGDPAALLGRIQNLFDLARQAVDAELGQTSGVVQERTPGGNGRSRHSEPPAGRFDRPNPVPGENRSTRYATASQVRAVRSICSRQDRDAVQLAHARFGVNDLEELTLQEASALIDELKAAAPAGNQRGGRNGGGR